ncbi:hypothetical protein SEQ01_03160 [Streptococcus equinus]|uniref:glycosyltransferase n=1 Tax=Streptococcus equinus TaxID=1335 RepID=UPI00114343D0|nr:glycosyltransferase [Streptococcus equinus]GEB10125.1 hypothetical protein SEQ01_03160 [Streptococcus equinus]
MDKEVKHAAIILNYRNPELTIACIRSLQKQDVSIKIVVVDNCSNDNSIEKLFSEFYLDEEITILENDSNSGYAKGNNVGINFVERNFPEIEYISIVNPDIFFRDERTFSLMEKALSNNPELSLVSSMILYNKEFRGVLDCGWKIPTKKYLFWSGTFLGRFILNEVNEVYTSLTVEKDISYVDVVPGCFFMVKANDFYQIHGFDENTFLYFEETILAKKLINIGKKEGILVNCLVEHNHMERDRQLVDWKRKLFDRECFNDSKRYYLNYISEETKFFKIAATLLSNVDIFFKKIIFNALALMCRNN